MNSIVNRTRLLPLNILQKQKLLVKNDQILFIDKAHKSVASAALKSATATSLIYLMMNYKKLLNKIQGKKPVKKEYPKDTIIIYQFPRAYRTPSLSQFALKLETWCRVMNLNYKNEFGMTRSSKGLIPFIRLNNFVVEDSQFCIDYLTRVFQVNLESDLSEEQKAISRLAVKLCEDSLKWPVILHRFWHSNKGIKETGLPVLSYWYFSYKVYKYGYNSGYSRFSKEELYEIGRKDLKALNDLIGKKKFLLNDSKPCLGDIAIFAIGSQIRFNDFGPLNQFLISECHNVVRVIDTIKELYWKDWTQNTLQGRSQIKAIKSN